MITLKIPQPTSKGYAEVGVGGVFDMSYPSSKTRRGRVQGHLGCLCPALTASGDVLLVFEGMEPNVLTHKRTEYGKQMRKKYEAGELDEGWGAMSEMVPREDGISNTLTTILKDNLVCEPISCAMRGREDDSGKYEQKIESGDDVANCITSAQKDSMVMEMVIGSTQKNAYKGTTDGVCPCITASCGTGGGMTPMVTEGLDIKVYDDYNQRVRNDSDTIGTITTNIGISAPRNGYKIIEEMKQQEIKIDGVTKEDLDGLSNALGRLSEEKNGSSQEESAHRKYRIRKLTPLECFRLQGVRDSDVKKIQDAGVSNSQQYKMAGNSITVDVLDNIFENLFYPEDEVLTLMP